MHFVIRKIQSFFLFFLLSNSLIAYSSDVFITSGLQVGQGFFWKFEDNCYAITPAHVVEDGTSDINLLTPDRQNHKAIIEHVFEDDLAILKVVSTGNPCPDKNIEPINDLDTILTVVKNGEIFTMLDDGSLMRSPIEVITSSEGQFLEIKAVDESRGFKQGYSGSVLYVANSISGMLVEVEDGHGYIHKFDSIILSVSSYFGINDEIGASYTSLDQIISSELATSQESTTELVLSKNSPILFDLTDMNISFDYWLEIFDEEGTRHFSDSFSGNSDYAFAYTPKSSGSHTIRVTGKRGHGTFKVKVSQYNLDSVLRGKANVFEIGDTLESKIANGAIAEYRFTAQKNSPIKLNLFDMNKHFGYWIEIFDEEGTRQYSDSYSGHSSYEFAYTPKSSGAHTIYVTGKSGHGKFKVKVSQYNLDSVLRGKANVFEIGDTLESKIAKGTIAEYRFTAQKNSPIKLNLFDMNKHFGYWVEIFDEEGTRQYSDSYSGHSSYEFVYTPKGSGAHTIYVTGKSGHGKFKVKVSQYNLDSVLRGKANVFEIGDTLESKIAKGTIAEYRFTAQKNSPIKLNLFDMNKHFGYRLEIFDEEGTRQYSDSYSGHSSYEFAYTPKSSGAHTIYVTGKGGHGKFKVKVSQYNLDSVLRGKANVFEIGDTLESKIANGAIAEYRFTAKKNSPIKFNLFDMSKHFGYRLEIFDEEGTRQYSDSYSGHSSYEFAYTPKSSGAHTIFVTGKGGHGKFKVKIVKG